MKEQLKKIRTVFLILIILCNVGTLFFVAPLRENLSYLGNELGHRFYLMLWGCSAALYFYYYTSKLLRRYHYPYWYGKMFLIISCACMALSVVMPYDPEIFPEISKWHIRIAMTGTGLYVTVFFHFLFDLMKKDFLFFEKSMKYYGFLVSFDLLLFILYGSVSSLLEISFTIGMAYILYWMNDK